ncbi:hypothetical protein J6590_049312 [Homalodisca vitripennis]|nr:hypothetical protein J6590_049312 [Homalodisca vitripennis]
MFLKLSWSSLANSSNSFDPPSCSLLETHLLSQHDLFFLLFIFNSNSFASTKSSSRNTLTASLTTALTSSITSDIPHHMLVPLAVGVNLDLHASTACINLHCKRGFSAATKVADIPRTAPSHNLHHVTGLAAGARVHFTCRRAVCLQPVLFVSVPVSDFSKHSCIYWYGVVASRHLSLIENYRDRPVLWNPTLFEYKDKNKTNNAWAEIAEELRINKAEVQSKMRNVTTQYNTGN